MNALTKVVIVIIAIITLPKIILFPGAAIVLYINHKIEQKNNQQKRGIV